MEPIRSYPNWHSQRSLSHSYRVDAGSSTRPAHPRGRVAPKVPVKLRSRWARVRAGPQQRRRTLNSSLHSCRKRSQRYDPLLFAVQNVGTTQVCNPALAAPVFLDANMPDRWYWTSHPMDAAHVSPPCPQFLRLPAAGRVAMETPRLAPGT